MSCDSSTSGMEWNWMGKGRTWCSSAFNIIMSLLCVSQNWQEYHSYQPLKNHSKINTRMQTQWWRKLNSRARTQVPGLILWYAPFYSNEKTKNKKRGAFFFGQNCVKASRAGLMTRDAKAVRAHLFSHRYSVENESIKDKLTYHSIVLLEWDHGKYCSVVEPLRFIV